MVTLGLFASQQIKYDLIASFARIYSEAVAPKKQQEFQNSWRIWQEEYITFCILPEGMPQGGSMTFATGNWWHPLGIVGNQVREHSTFATNL